MIFVNIAIKLVVPYPSLSHERNKASLKELYQWIHILQKLHSFLKYDAIGSIRFKLNARIDESGILSS